MAAAAPVDEVYSVISVALDGAFYRAVNPDLAEADIDPVRHFADTGWREGRDPAPWFSTLAYVKAYPEVAKAGLNPLHHYLTRGRWEGRDIERSGLAERYLLARAERGEEPAWSFEALTPGAPIEDPIAEVDLTQYRERVLAATEFDEAYYLEVNPDVATAGLDPLDHFMANGWREGRDPNPSFSVLEYIESYPDIAAAGINPFVHFLSAGRIEGRVARTNLGFRYEIIKRLVPVEKRVATVARASARLKLGSATGLGKGLAAAARTGLADLHITFSHDDYSTNTGGVQFCLQRESAQFAAMGRDHLHVFPAKPWPVVRLADEPGHLGVLLNGQPLGVFAPKTIAAALRKAVLAVEPGERSFAIHSLLGHAADETADIVSAVGLQAGFFWLHDFASLCAGFHLLRNDVEDCAAPPPDSAACGVCVYGPWRSRHMAEHKRLFERLSLTVVSPSQPTLDLWKARSRCAAATEVILPHARLEARGPAPVRPGRPLRVAYAGMPSAHKGWDIFRDLAAKFAKDPRYHFLHLGGRAPAGSPIEFHKVTVTAAKPRAMQSALEEHMVDVVLIWPLCRETFSFVAYEAVAAGAAIITGPDSGNVAAFVSAGGHGRVLASEDALTAAFRTGKAAALARAMRAPGLFDLAFSGFTADLVERAA